MHAACRVDRRILQHAGAIDDRIDAREAAQPVLEPCRAGDIERHPFRLRLEAARPRRIPGEPANLMPPIEKPGDHSRADQAGRANHQYAHREHNVATGERVYPLTYAMVRRAINWNA